jgi:predicted nucleotidyltransferase
MLTVQEVLTQCKRFLTQTYGAQLKGVVLYGSMARGEATPESDIDLLVLLDAPFDYFQELRRIVNLLYPAQLESDYLISAKPAALEAYERGQLQLYRNARREGLQV